MHLCSLSSPNTLSALSAPRTHRMSTFPTVWAARPRFDLLSPWNRQCCGGAIRGAIALTFPRFAAMCWGRDAGTPRLFPAPPPAPPPAAPPGPAGTAGSTRQTPARPPAAPVQSWPTEKVRTSDPVRWCVPPGCICMTGGWNRRRAKTHRYWWMKGLAKIQGRMQGWWGSLMSELP